jgi:hypothetical protein
MQKAWKGLSDVSSNLQRFKLAFGNIFILVNLQKGHLA